MSFSIESCTERIRYPSACVFPPPNFGMGAGEAVANFYQFIFISLWKRHLGRQYTQLRFLKHLVT